MKRNIILVISIFVVLVVAQSCQPKNTYKIGYVNLQEVYKSIPELSKADTIHQLQLMRLETYVKAVEQNLKLEEDNLTKKDLNVIVEAYNDTINNYKNMIEGEYVKVVSAQKNRIQSAIDSIAKTGKFNYVLSTNNTNILYVRDSTNNITSNVIHSVK